MTDVWQPEMESRKRNYQLHFQNPELFDIMLHITLYEVESRLMTRKVLLIV